MGIRYTKELIILVGIPCSGKSTYTAKQQLSLLCQCISSVSRDRIREKYGKNQYTKASEDFVTRKFSDRVNNLLNRKAVCKIILDNTHCKEKYIDEIINRYERIGVNIKIKFFDISLSKAHYRNVVRYFKTGKWIPIRIMNQMYKNYNKINKSKYDKFKV